MKSNWIVPDLCYRHPLRRDRSGWVRSFGLRVLALVATIALAAGEARAADVVLVNRSGIAVAQLYVSPCGGKHWGPNQLVGTLVESSRSFTVSDLPPGCYDLRVVFPPWNECTINGAAVYKRFVWTLTWSTTIEGTFADCARTAHVVSDGQRPWIPYDRER
jgi:hypothetical protein